MFATFSGAALFWDPHQLFDRCFLNSDVYLLRAFEINASSRGFNAASFFCLRHIGSKSTAAIMAGTVAAPTMAENTRQTSALGITPFRKRLEVIVSVKPAKPPPPPKPKRSAKANRTKPKNPSRPLGL